MVVLAMMLAALLASLQTGGALPVQALPSTQRATVQVIVEVARGANPVGVARGLGVVPSHVYSEVFQGFATALPPEALRAINQRGVLTVWPDLPVQTEAQTMPTGVDRVDADQDPWAAMGNAGVDADVAVLDTGIDGDHPDLNVVDGVDCSGNDTDNWTDGNGHGTHVAGTIAAIDNDQGAVGVAAGARLWAVKVLDDSGAGSISSVLCGLDWVSKNTDKIDVVNMSLSAKAGRKDQRSCGPKTTPLHKAICQIVKVDGIPVVVAAGNNGRNASKRAPATYSEVITVSAFTDFDGKPGKEGQSSSCGGRDDTFARFSNYGRDIDIAAPGVCIYSTLPGGYGKETGTSMATPHVTGAVALYTSLIPAATVADVRTWLEDVVSRPNSSPYGFTGDPDNYDEGVLYLGPDSQ